MAKFFSPLKVVRYVVTPFKSLATFENYFAISAATSNNSHQDYQKLVWQFKLLLTTVLYYSCFQAFQNYYLPWSTFTPEVHLLTVDLVYFGRLPGRFHLLLSTQSAMVAYLLTLFYFRPNAYLNRLLANVFFGSTPFRRPSKKTKKYCQVLQNLLLLERKKHNSRKMLCGVLSMTSQHQSLSEAVLPVALSVTAFIDLFTLFVHPIVLVVICRFLLIYWELCLSAAFSTSPEVAIEQLLGTLPLLLLNAAVTLTTVYAYVAMVGLLASYAFVLLYYVHLLMRINKRQLQEVLFKSGNGSSLSEVLHANLAIFQLLFQMDAFIGSAFFTFLLANFPSFASCAMMVLFNRRRPGEEEDFTVMIVLFGIVLYEIIGTLGVHVLFARLSRHLHSSAVLLVNYSAKVGVVAGNCQPFSSLRHQLTLWRHTMRLLTVRRYGITYGVIGVIVTMTTFARVCEKGVWKFKFKFCFCSQCLLLFGKLLMYSYSMVRIHNKHNSQGPSSNFNSGPLTQS